VTRVSVDPSRCALSGWCAEIAPRVFRIEDGQEFAQAAATASEWEVEDADLVRQAAAACPTAAITVQDG
jgi:ferredoxin